MNSWKGSALFLLSSEGSTSKGIWSLGWLDTLCCCSGIGIPSPHPVELCTCVRPMIPLMKVRIIFTKYEVLSDGPEADSVLKGIPTREFLGYIPLPCRLLAADKGVIFVVLQAEIGQGR